MDESGGMKVEEGHMGEYQCQAIFFSEPKERKNYRHGSGELLWSCWDEKLVTRRWKHVWNICRSGNVWSISSVWVMIIILFLLSMKMIIMQLYQRVIGSYIITIYRWRNEALTFIQQVILLRMWLFGFISLDFLFNDMIQMFYSLLVFG